MTYTARFRALGDGLDLEAEQPAVTRTATVGYS